MELVMMLYDASLNLDSLAWAQNSPPDGLNSAPPARSAAISGDDFASS